MVRKTSKKKVLPLLVIISAIIFTGLIGAITFQQIAPTTNPFVTPLPNVTISTGVHCPDGCSSFTESWNGTNTTLYDSSLVLFMNFDNRSALGENDTIVKDLSMYGNNGTVVGGENITWGAGYGKYGGAFNFSGNKGWINITDADSLSNNYTAMTWSFWVNQAKIISYVPYLMKYNSDVNQRGWRIRSYASNKEIQFGMSPNLTTGFSYYSDNSCGADIGSWTYIAVVYNSTHVIFYKNGNYCYIRSIPYNYIANDAYFMSIGYDKENNVLFNGSIDEVKVFNRSLSASEIYQDYSSNYYKLNSSFWIVNSTQNTSILSQYSFICSKNRTEVEFCSSNQITRKVNNIQSNYSTSFRTILSDFYGVDLFIWGSPHSWIDTDDDDVLDTDSNYQEHRNAFLNSNMNLIRINMELDKLAPADGVFNTTANTSNYRNILARKEQVKFAYDNNLTVYLLITGTPNWLSNITTTWCNWTVANLSCPPNNYSRYGQLVKESIDYITNNGEYNSSIKYIEIGNEPYGSSWLNNLSNDNLIKATEMVKLINNSIDEVHKVYPNIKISGGTGYGFSSSGNMVNTVLSNLSSKLGFYPVHSYPNYTVSSNYSNFGNIVQNISALCSGNSCNIIFSEVTPGDSALILNSSNQILNSVENALFYYAELYSNLNFSNIYFTWSTENKYGDTYYPFDLKYNMFSESLLDNEYSGAYNVTKNFAHLCPAGATVSVTSSDSTCLKQVACQKGNMYALIPINVCDYAINVTVNMTNNTNSKIFPYTSIMNYETGASIPVSTQGIIQLGVLDSYEVLYLTSGDEDGASQTNFFKFNEATGTRVYDLLQNVTYGTISGASWVNDGIFKTLTSAIDYTISTSGLLVVSSSYLFNYMNASWSYLATWRDTGSTASLVMVDSLGNSTTFLSILIVISFAVVILTLFKPSVNTNPLGKPHY